MGRPFPEAGVRVRVLLDGVEGGFERGPAVVGLVGLVFVSVPVVQVEVAAVELPDGGVGDGAFLVAALVAELLVGWAGLVDGGVVAHDAVLGGADEGPAPPCPLESG
jgi:hypothetical protein